jgi:uncharacterized membrane protein YqjE
VERPEARMTQSDIPDRDRPAGEQSVSAALEHLVAGSQGVITKRIELALLEGQELLSRTLQRAALVGVGIVVAAAAWFAVAACVVLLVTPDASVVVRLAAFGLLNGGVAVGLGGLAIRRGLPQTRVLRTAMRPVPQCDPLPAEGKN